MTSLLGRRESPFPVASRRPSLWERRPDSQATFRVFKTRRWSLAAASRVGGRPDSAWPRGKSLGRATRRGNGAASASEICSGEDGPTENRSAVWLRMEWRPMSRSCRHRNHKAIPKLRAPKPIRGRSASSDPLPRRKNRRGQNHLRHGVFTQPGSIATETRCPHEVRFTPNIGSQSGRLKTTLWANNRH
jgi:hypothetical protein